jgi:hypothetical protein
MDVPESAAFCNDAQGGRGGDGRQAGQHVIAVEDVWLLLEFAPTVLVFP